tara:strand:- start:88 stop:843 length:756 start_codon:yes stop_codon:yes gene_type:complete
MVIKELIIDILKKVLNEVSKSSEEKPKPNIYYNLASQGPLMMKRQKKIDHNQSLFHLIIPESSMPKTFTSFVNGDGIFFRDLGKTEELLTCLTQDNGLTNKNPDLCILKKQAKQAGISKEELEKIENNVNDEMKNREYQVGCTLFYDVDGVKYQIYGRQNRMYKKGNEYIVEIITFDKIDIKSENEIHQPVEINCPHTHTKSLYEAKEIVSSELEELKIETWCYTSYSPLIVAVAVAAAAGGCAYFCPYPK